MVEKPPDRFATQNILQNLGALLMLISAGLGKQRLVPSSDSFLAPPH
jgi:hypothetical protein